MTRTCTPIQAELPPAGWAALDVLLPQVPSDGLTATLVAQSPKSSVYRIRAEAGERYILKRHPAARAEAEASIYRDVLDPLGLTSAGCFGVCVEPRPDQRHAWLAMGDAGDGRVRPGTAVDGWSAALWLAAAHLATAGKRVTAALAPRDAPFYRDALHLCLDRMADHLSSHEAPSGESRRVIESLHKGLSRVDTRWAVVEDLCAALPPMLVHADFVPKNLAIDLSTPPVLRPLDWETAGVGSPAPDIAELAHAWPEAVNTYVAMVGPSWPDLHGPLLAELVGVGRVMRLILGTEWATQRLASRSESTIVGYLGTYRQWLETALDAPPWRTRPGGSRARS